jgi:tetratricopeptide (TPR) repeat protein
MFAYKKFFERLFWGCALILALGFLGVRAQEGTVAEIKYKEDYDRIQKIITVSDPLKRANQMLTFYKEKPDLDPKLRDYADNIFARDLEAIMKQGNYIALRGLCEQALKVRPKFGEVHLFHGVVLKNENKIQEAMNAFAKCYLIKNPLQAKAKQQLDVTYRASSGGSLIGEEKIIKNAKEELK